jgi:hypothetical protein
MLNGLYFSRFYRNSEPLVTPELMKLTLRGPLTLSTQMLAAVDQLQLMVTDLQAGKQVAREDLSAKTQEIRDLARKIRQDESLTFVDRLWTHGANNSEMVNPVAAMPSLHAGYSMLFTWFFFKRTRRVWAKALLALYPLVMAFTLVFGGEHYMIDILAGWVLAILAVELSDHFHDWRQLRRVRATQSAEASAEEEAAPVAV